MRPLPFGENHRRHILHSFVEVDKCLAELEFLASRVDRASPFSRFTNDLSPTEVRVLLDHFDAIRTAMLAHLQEVSIPLEVRRTSVRWAFQTNLMQVQVGIDEMGPRQLERYGELDESGRAAAVRIQEDLTRLLDRTRAYLMQGLGRDLSDRLARLDSASPGVAELTALDRIVTRHRLIEYRPTLDMIAARLESPTYEIAVFGRVSTGKSSLLNHLVGLDVLPVGVTPITAVPTRLEYGEEVAVTVSFAESRARTIATDQLWEYASEGGNPGNAKHVTGINVAVPSPRLRSGVAFIDTPGVGSLAASGAAGTLAYLPRCDLGLVLVDAASSLTPDDITLLRLLYEAASPAIVLLSRSDLLTPTDRLRMMDYIQVQIRRQLGLDLSVSPVSVKGAAKALLSSWFDAELGPLMARHRELVTASLRRKIANVSEAVRTTLDIMASSRRPSGVNPSEIHRLLDEADTVIREARERWEAWSMEREPLMSAVLEAAARGVVMGRGAPPGTDGDWLSGTVAEVLAIRARSAHDLAMGLKQELGQVLDGLRRAAPATAAEVVSVREMRLDGLPLPELGAFRYGGDGLRPWWARLIPWFAKSAVEERIWKRFGSARRDVVESYDHQLQSWLNAALDCVTAGFELQASLFREQVRRLGSVAVVSDESGSDESDLGAREEGVAQAAPARPAIGLLRGDESA